MADELERRYRESLREKKEVLEDAVPGVEEGDEEALAMVRRVAHVLRGSGGTYGFPGISTGGHGAGGGGGRRCAGASGGPWRWSWASSSPSRRWRWRSSPSGAIRGGPLDDEQQDEADEMREEPRPMD